ncbi:hypothetical protein [Maricaulis sp.]|uniref:hypothetical protein n=1 Tax=Maricaulis sp. TaxID=1486257 RepID=UPI003A917F67
MTTSKARPVKPLKPDGKARAKQVLRERVLAGARAPITGLANAAWFDALREGVRRP